MTKRSYLGEFEQVVLLATARLGPGAYGMSIRREIEETTGRSVSIGAIYSTLDRLQTKGYLGTRLGEATPTRGGRPKRYFRLRAPGIEALRESRQHLDRLWDGLDLETE